MRTLKATLVIIGVVQLMLGVFLLVPDLFATTVGFADAPSWVNWLFAMLGARALGFAYGMFVAARDPRRHITWIRAMISIQAIDWIGTLAYLAAGAVTISQVTTAAFLPVIFIVILGRFAFSPDARAVDVKHSEAQRA